jgi:hypothetical protein
MERTRAGLQAAWRQGRVGDRQQDSGCKKAFSKRDTAIRDGAQFRRVGPHVVSLGAGLFTDKKFAVTGRMRPPATKHIVRRQTILKAPGVNDEIVTSNQTVPSSLHWRLTA